MSQAQPSEITAPTGAAQCLDHFIVFGTQHMDHLCQEYLAHHHEERPHQRRDNEVMIRRQKPTLQKTVDALPTLNEIRCRSWLGGLLKDYERRAA